MTAGKPTRVGSDNSTPTGGADHSRRTDRDEQLQSIIAAGGGTITMAALRDRADWPERVLRGALETLRKRGEISVATGWHQVRISIEEGRR